MTFSDGIFAFFIHSCVMDCKKNCIRRSLMSLACWKIILKKSFVMPDRLRDRESLSCGFRAEWGKLYHKAKFFIYMKGLESVFRI